MQKCGCQNDYYALPKITLPKNFAKNLTKQSVRVITLIT